MSVRITKLAETFSDLKMTFKESLLNLDSIFVFSLTTTGPGSRASEFPSMTILPNLLSWDGVAHYQ